MDLREAIIISNERAILCDVCHVAVQAALDKFKKLNVSIEIDEIKFVGIEIFFFLLVINFFHCLQTILKWKMCRVNRPFEAVNVSGKQTISGCELCRVNRLHVKPGCMKCVYKSIDAMTKLSGMWMQIECNTDAFQAVNVSNVNFRHHHRRLWTNHVGSRQQPFHRCEMWSPYNQTTLCRLLKLLSGKHLDHHSAQFSPIVVGS